MLHAAASQTISFPLLLSRASKKRAAYLAGPRRGRRPRASSFGGVVAASCFAVGAISCAGGRIARAQTGVLSPAASPSPAAQPPRAGQNAKTAGTMVVLPASYRIGPGDGLDISVFEKPELARSISVPPDGRINFPFAGEIVVAGLTVGELRTTLTQRLAREISAPQVTISLTRQQAQEVSILGPVKNPGKRILGANWRLLELLADSGGLILAKPEWAAAILVRGGGTTQIEVDVAKLMSGDPLQNIPVEANDVLLIREAEPTLIALRVEGEVVKPSSVIVPKDGSLVSVITDAGGFTPRAALARATLTRNGNTYVVDLRDLMNTGRAVIVADSAKTGPSVSTGLTTATGGLSGTPPAPGVRPPGAQVVPPLPSPNGNGAAAPGTSVLPIGAVVKAEPGDVLLIPQNRLLFAVQGAVNRPDVLNFPESKSVTVLSALSMAGGLNASANLKEASLVRPNDVTGQPEIHPINLEELFKARGENDKRKKNKDGTEVRDIAMQPGDILFVPDKEPGRSKFGLRDVLGLLPFYGLFAR